MSADKRGYALVLFLAAMAQAQAAEIAGVKLDDKARVGAAELVLNGAGIRTRAIFKVYVGGLYLTEKKSTPAEVLALAGAKRVSMSMLRDVGAQTLAEALVEGIRNNHGAAEIEALKPRIEQLQAIMQSIGEARSGQVIQLDYVPESGTRVTVNGESKGGPIAGEDFYRALLRVWLGDKPADADLKKGMLGQGG